MDKLLASPWEKFKGFLFRLLPHHSVSRITYWCTRQRSPLVKSAINSFIKFFNVDMRDAKVEDIQHYKTFNDFFTRELRADSRPIDSDPKSIVCPCDGTISMLGPIQEHTLIQAKNKYFSLSDFCTPACKYINHFADGSFFTIYLSPRVYHRVHMPCDARLLEMIYVPGRLFSVAPYAPKTIDKLYARNERVVSIFSVKHGYMAVVMVGAVNVAAIETRWAGLITPPRLSSPLHYDYQSNEQVIELQKGQHMGTFNMGSTVVLLLSNNFATLLQQSQNEQEVRMGQAIGIQV